MFKTEKEKSQTRVRKRNMKMHFFSKHCQKIFRIQNKNIQSRGQAFMLLFHSFSAMKIDENNENEKILRAQGD